MKAKKITKPRKSSQCSDFQGPENHKRFSRKTKFSELMKDDNAGEILMEKGMHCFGCPFSQVETLEQGCKAHGLNTEEIVKELNSIVKKEKKK